MEHYQTYQDIYNGSSRRRWDGKGAKRVFVEVTAKNFLNLMKTINLDSQEAQQTPSNINIQGLNLET